MGATNEAAEILPAFTVLVIPANVFEPCRLEEIIGGRLEYMQRLVEGYIEAVRVDWGRLYDPTVPEGVNWARQATLYVNEEYRFYPELRWNGRASLLYPWAGGIYGQAFLAGTPTPEGYDTSVPEEATKFFLQ